MKKTVFVLSAILTTVAAQANITHNKGDQGKGEAHVDRAGGIHGVQNSVVFYTDSYVSYEYMGVGENNNGKRDLSTWGDITLSMYTLDAENNILETFSVESAMGSGTFSQMMQAGVDKVGFSISNGETTIYSTPGTNGSTTGTNVSTAMADGVLYIGFFVEGYTQNYNDRADAIYAISVSSQAPGGPNGQPLPGVLASALIGAGVLGLRRRARK